jgi:hypothetical protein
MINRRDFLKLLLASASAEFIDYEKLLWVPGEKKIFLPDLDYYDAFYGGMAGGGKSLLFGVPYPYTDEATRIWLGFSRFDFRPFSSSQAHNLELPEWDKKTADVSHLKSDIKGLLND